MTPGRAWQAANAVMLVVFVFSAVVQVNDPDPWRWMPVYAAAAAACGLVLRGRLVTWVPIAIGLGSLAWAATIAPHVLGKVPFVEMFGAWEMRDAGVEESREMYGLVIVGLWMAVLAIQARRWSPKRP